MKTYESTYYTAHEKKMAFALEKRFRDEQETREAIAEARIREVENGFKPTEYIIIRNTYKSIYDENGLFVGDTTFGQRVGVNIGGNDET